MPIPKMNVKIEDVHARIKRDRRLTDELMIILIRTSDRIPALKSGLGWIRPTRNTYGVAVGSIIPVDVLSIIIPVGVSCIIPVGVFSINSPVGVTWFIPVGVFSILPVDVLIISTVGVPIP